jgi:chemotaxis signal transduction protein
MLQRFLVVRVGAHRVAVPERSLVEVARAVALTKVPGTANALVAGICNLRGKASVVLDLRAGFGVAAAPPRASDALVFVRAHDRSVGLLVDRIDDFVDLDDEHLVDARGVSPALGDRCRVAEVAEGLLVVVDMAAFVTASELDAAEMAELSERAQASS